MEEKHGRRLILADGTVLEDGECGCSGGMLWCWIRGTTLREAAEIFLDAGKTARIVFEYGGMSDTYEGFTECAALTADEDGSVTAGLRRSTDA